MENVTLLKCNNFTPSQVFFKNFQNLQMDTYNEKYLKGTASVADFLLHVRGFFLFCIIFRSTTFWNYVYIFNKKLNKSSQHKEK